MKRIFHTLHSALKLFGIDFLQLVNSISGLPFFIRDYRQLKKQKGTDETFATGKWYPVLNERNAAAGTMSGHYFHQDLLIAGKVYKANPKRHIDIGSRIDGFVAHVAAFRSIEIIDIRKQTSKARNITFRQADLMELPPDLIESCDSISSLHVIEHFGLGRYGDPIDYWGYQKAIDNIAKIVSRGGTFYLSTPIGPQRIEFNSQRVFSVRFLLDILSQHFSLSGFSYVDDQGDLHEEVTMAEDQIDRNFGCYYGCGIFELIKK